MFSTFAPGGKTTTTFSAEHDNTFDKLCILLSKTPIPEGKKQNGLISLSIEDTVYNALKTLSAGMVISAPVFGASQAFMGFCDYMQLTRFVVRRYSHKDVTGFGKGDEMIADLKSVTLSDLMFGRANGGGAMQGEISAPIGQHSSMLQAFQRMAVEGRHRLALSDLYGRIVGIVTQSQVVNLIYEHMAEIGFNARSTTIQDMRPHNVLVTTSENAQALKAFALLDEHTTSLNGLAVVDASGRLTDALSTHDLKGLLPGDSEFCKLFGTVKDFKHAIRTKYWPTVRDNPVSLKRTATFEELVTQLVNSKVHRVFIVDDAECPVDVITITDILRFVLDTSTNTWWGY